MSRELSWESGVGNKDFKFEGLEVYQRSRKLARKVYQLTSDWPKEFLYDISSQFRRAAISILLNIAEGSGRSERVV